MRFRLASYALLAVGAPVLLFSMRSSLQAPSPPDPLSLKGEGEKPTGAADQSSSVEPMTVAELKTDREKPGSAERGGVERVRYPYGTLHSPMAKDVVEHLKAVLASSKGRPGVVAKVGDSLTVNSYFLGCFAGKDVRLGDHADLEPTRAFFTATPADATHTSFDRTTLSAKVCWSSAAVVGGSPCPLEQEITAIEPTFAVVLIGTNDTYLTGPALLDEKLLRIVDISLSRGVIPILTTIPQRRDSTEAMLLVPEMNAVIRAIAQERQVPLIDLFASLVDLPHNGLGKDGIHLATYSDGIMHGCWFDERSLEKGINRRNLLTLTALDRARRFLIENQEPEPDPKPLQGDGVWQSPFEIEGLPFVDDREPSKIGISERSTYEGSTADERGPEVVYRIELAERMALRARLFHSPHTAMHLHLLEGAGPSARSLQMADKILDITVGPGVYEIVIDTPGGGAPVRGDYRLTVVRPR